LNGAKFHGPKFPSVKLSQTGTKDLPTDSKDSPNSEDDPKDSSSDSRESVVSTDSSGEGDAPVDVDDETSFIQESIDGFDFPDSLVEVEQLRTMPPADALAYMLWAKMKATANPSGLLLTRLRMNQPPPPDMEERVAAALELRTLDLEEIERHRRTQEYEQLRQDAVAHRDRTAVQPTRHGDGRGLDEKPGDGALTWRDVWRAVMGQLRLQLNHSTYAGWVEGAKAISFMDGVLTVQAKHIMALDVLDHQIRRSVEVALEQIAGQPVSVQFVIAEPIRTPAVVEG